MMKVYLHHKSLFDVEYEAIGLPVDGSAKNMGGAIVRQYIELVGEDYWESIQDMVLFPFPNGVTRLASLPGTEAVPYRYAAFMGILGHAPDDDPARLVRGALTSAAEYMDQRAIRRLAVPILSGGTRLTPEKALLTMLAVAERAKRGEMHIAIPDRKTYEMALAHIPSFPEEGTT